MCPDEKSGIFLNLTECKSLFRKLKKDEPKLTDDELLILHKIEKKLYSELTIWDIEELNKQDNICLR